MKKLITAVLTFCFMLGSVSVFALEPDALIGEAYFYTGSFYYCDPVRNKVVLRNVKPMGTVNEQNTATARDAEYTELDILGEAQVGDGSTVPLENCNRFADSNVRVLMIRSRAKGPQVISIKFL